MQSVFSRHDLVRDVDITNYYVFRDGFSAAEVEQMRGLVDRDCRQAGTAGGSVDPQYRSSSIVWLANTPANRWVYDKVAMFVREANKQCFGFELTGFGEDAQVSTYHPGDHYDWHVDVGRQQPWRKVSVSIQLSADDAYSGGDLELQYGRVPKKMPREQGTVVVFPSFLLHRITPVTSGTRQSLVVWVSGVPFR